MFYVYLCDIYLRMCLVFNDKKTKPMRLFFSLVFLHDLSKNCMVDLFETTGKVPWVKAQDLFTMLNQLAASPGDIKVITSEHFFYISAVPHATWNTLIINA